ncbi:hypothetical protein [Poseidonocella sedimentorum]|uniref:Uncharacterized protein n=1 Tax=Poseidonocella sedimentorum TaxID=871652 RepID=A0A1I6D5E1_9RHOB|nr:hypothetical protein [Poseidonocella sedimentorum]SFR00699.1 hypothetical protein SAMN04515673_102204 [Poseidonocella sedimentorum]
MDDMTHKLQELSKLTDLAFQRASAPLAEYARREAELRKAIAALTPSSEYFASQEVSDDAKETVRRGGAAMAWDRWAAKRKSQLNMDLARVLAEKAGVEAQARRAFGRSEVARHLLVDHKKG